MCEGCVRGMCHGVRCLSLRRRTTCLNLRFSSHPALKCLFCHAPHSMLVHVSPWFHLLAHTMCVPRSFTPSLPHPFVSHTLTHTLTHLCLTLSPLCLTLSSTQGRALIEASTAAKCPSVTYQLAGAKKVQQDLAAPGVVERFVGQEQGAALRQLFAGNRAGLCVCVNAFLLYVLQEVNCVECGVCCRCGDLEGVEH